MAGRWRSARSPLMTTRSRWRGMKRWLRGKAPAYAWKWWNLGSQASRSPSTSAEWAPVRCRRRCWRARLLPPVVTPALRRNTSTADDTLSRGETPLNAAADRNDASRTGPRVPLRDHVATSIRRYLGDLNGCDNGDLY